MKRFVNDWLILTVLVLCYTPGASILAQSPTSPTAPAQTPTETTTAPATTRSSGPRPPLPQKIAASYADRVEFVRDVPYSDGKNKFQMVDIYLPKKRNSDKPLPVIAMIHGGGWGGGNRTFFTARACDYASTGDYAVVCVGYRLTGEAKWPAQIHDCKAAIRLIRARVKDWNLDPDRIGVLGGSAGGHLGLLVATTGNVRTLDGEIGPHKDTSSAVTCLVNFCGPCDLTQPLTNDRRMAKPIAEMVFKLLGGEPTDLPEIAREASPLTYISKDTPPVITVHGTGDNYVDFKMSERLDAALKRVSVKSYLVPMVKIDHNFIASPTTLGRVKQFLDLYLRDIPSEISTEPIPFADAVLR
jgi:acetyl esterase/lipase